MDAAVPEFQTGYGLLRLSRTADYRHVPSEVEFQSRAEPGLGHPIEPSGDVLRRLATLSSQARFDISSSPEPAARRAGSLVYKTVQKGLYESHARDGRRVVLYKPLLSSRCTFDCRYCHNSCLTGHKGTKVTPEEMAHTFLGLQGQGLVQGLFLSSSIDGDEESAMEDMVRTVELIRHRGFHGYIHLKVLPGAPLDLVKRGGEVSDRLSINMEAPSSSRLQDLSSIKEYGTDLLRRQMMIRDIERKGGLRSGQTTQYIVWPHGGTDLEHLRAARWEYEKMGLRRVYYSGFTPICGTPMADVDATPPWREFRLYQCDWLLREYGFSFQEVKGAIDQEGMLPNDDPKATIARLNMDGPIEVNDASYDELIRVPGIGPVAAGRLVRYRRSGRGRSISRWQTLVDRGVIRGRAEPFLKVGGSIQRGLSGWGEYAENQS